MEFCPCGSENRYESCCKELISSQRSACTAQELIRSRYTAYVKTELDYIVRTTHPTHVKSLDKESMRSWSEKTEWQRFEILECTGGGDTDTSGTVEFIAYYKDKNTACKHHEVAKCTKVDGVWYYEDSEFPKQKQIKNRDQKTQRNDPCICGSGKKYKKCCGKTLV